MATSDYDPLRRTAEQNKAADKVRAEELAKQKAELGKQRDARNQQLKQQNAHAYPTLDAAHKEEAHRAQAERDRKDALATTKAQMARNPYEAVREQREAAAKSKPLQVERPSPPSAPQTQRPGRTRGDVQLAPGGSMFTARAEYFEKRRASQPVAKGEMTEAKVAKASTQGAKEMTEGRVKRIARIKMKEGLAQSLDKASASGRGGRGGAAD